MGIQRLHSIAKAKVIVLPRLLHVVFFLILLHFQEKCKQHEDALDKATRELRVLKRQYSAFGKAVQVRLNSLSATQLV